MNAWSLRYTPRAMPGHGRVTTRLPASFVAASAPFAPITFGCTPKNGRAAEPGFMSTAPGMVIMTPPDSVCHQVSATGQRPWPMAE